MRVLLFGYPLSHSLSPRFQNAAFRALGLPHRYELHPIPLLALETVGELIRRPDVLGANVTVPHKRAAMLVVEELTPLCAQVGAVNTIYKDDHDRIVGDNTDIEGLHADLGRLLDSDPIETAVLLGAGGAARGALLALSRRCAEIVVLNRTLANAEEMVAQLSPHVLCESLSCLPWPKAALHDGLLERIGLIVDATSMGASGEACKRPPLELGALGLSKTRPDALFYDLKYGARTPLGTLARDLERRFSDGLGMLVYQGAASFERWTGRSAPVEVMFSAVDDGMSRRSIPP